MSRVVWITGAAGFTGRHLTAYLHTLPDRPRIVGLDLQPASSPHLDAAHAIDLADGAAVRALAAQEPPAIVIHLAGLLPPASDGEMWRVNVGGTASLLHALRAAAAPIARFVGIGSAAEYSREARSPIDEEAPCAGASAYGTTKVAQTLLSMHLGAAFGFDVSIARPFNLIGPGLPARLVAAALLRQFLDAPDGVIRVGNTHTARDFVDVRDVVRAYWLLATSPNAAGVFNVCSGVPTTIEQLLRLLGDITRRSTTIAVDPERVRPDDPVEVYGNPARLRRATGWQPAISLERSLHDMMVHT